MTTQPPTSPNPTAPEPVDGATRPPSFGPLAGLKVVHATQSTAAPFTGLLLAEWGADVIWIENSAAPDFARLGRSFNHEAERINQRAIALNIPSPAGREVFGKLLAEADVFFESTRGGQYASWGLTDEALWEFNPKLVIGHLSGFGHEGLSEFTSRPSFDPIAQAFTGYMNSNRVPDQRPFATGPYMADYVAGLFLLGAILAALYRRDRTGEGESIDLAQVETMLKVQNHLADWLSGHTVPKPTGAVSDNVGWGAYQAADGQYLQLCFAGAGVIAKAVRFLGYEPGVAPFPSFIPLLWRDQESGQLIEAAILEYLSRRTAKEAEAEFLAADIPVAVVNTHADIEHHPHLEARGTFQQWTNVKGATVRSVGAVPSFSRAPGQFWRTAPGFGQDNEDVLGSLGYSPAEIAELYDGKILGKDADFRFTWPREG